MQKIIIQNGKKVLFSFCDDENYKNVFIVKKNVIQVKNDDDDAIHSEEQRHFLLRCSFLM